MKKKFIYCNYDLDGLELKPVPPECEIDNHARMIPAITDEELAKPSVDFNPEERFKLDSRGRRLPIDESGKWIRRSKHWQPEEVPDNLWKEAPEETRELWRVMFPDPRKMPLEDSSGDLSAKSPDKDSTKAQASGSHPSEPSEPLRKKKLIEIPPATTKKTPAQC